MQEDVFQAGIAEPGYEVLQPSRRDDRPFIEDDRVRTELGHVVHQMRRKQDRGALLGLFKHQFIKYVRRFDVESVGGFIEDQQFGLVKHCHPQPKLFLHPPRVILGIIVEILG